MQTLQVIILLSLLIAAASEEAPGLSDVTFEAEDACAPGTATAECEVSFRQLRGERAIAQHGMATAARREQQDPIVLGSSVTEGIGYKHTWNYNLQPYEPGVPIYNSFSETKTEVSWEFQSAVISVEGQPTMFETVDDHRPLGLRIEVSSTLAGLLDAHCDIRVGRMDDIVESKLPGGKPSSSQMQYFHMPAPGCFGRKDCFSRKPPGGFAKAIKLSTGQQAKDVLNFNLTSILDEEHTSAIVWVTPHNVTVDGRWKTPVYKIQNWRFFNVDDSYDATPEESDDEDWGWY